MQDVVARLRTKREKLRLPALDLRIGLHCGPVMAGVVGRRKFTYDIWGDAVNVAARLEAASEPNRINVSEQVLNRVRTLVEATPRGPLEARNKAPIPMVFIDRLKPEFSADPAGRQPNERLATVRDAPASGHHGWSRPPPPVA
jgi:class 3 adenylate cyclase